MFGKTITLFKMFGFAVRIDLSWLVILALVVWSLTEGVFPSMYHGLQWQTYFAMGLAGAAALFMSIILHELCHSLVARRYGIPMKGITLFIFGGVAEMTDEPPSAKAEFMMAIAGPISSLVIAGVFYGSSLIGESLAWPMVLTVVLRWIGYINAILAAFNMIPGFPLDGGRVLRSILWYKKRDLRKATDIAAKVGSAVGLILIGLGIFTLLTGDPIGGLWQILIGWFLRNIARQAYQQVLIRQALQGEHVRRFMNAQPVTVPSTISIADLVEHFIYKHHFKMFPVVDDGRLAGCVTTREVRAVPRDQWTSHAVAEILTPCTTENTVGPDEDAMKALSMMSRSRLSRLLVVENGQLVGILSLKDLMKFLSLKLELESEGGKDAPPQLEPED